MAPNIIYCAPIPFNIVFHNANKGKMRINVLDLSRFCCASWDASERASEPGPGCFVFLYPSRIPLRLAPHPFLPQPLFIAGCATSRASTHTAERNTPTPGIFFPLACFQRIFLSKSFPPPLPLSSSSSFSVFLPHSSFVRSFVPLEKLSLDVVATRGKNDARCFVARTLERGSFGRRALKIFTP